jgi:bacteriorhodopsin
MISLTIGAMIASLAFSIFGRKNVSPKYRTSLMICSLVALIAAYHYFRIYESWQAAYTLTDGMYQYSGQPFNDAYRYVDWFLTVPLLVIELVFVLGLPKGKTAEMIGKLGLSAALMIGLGYPGEVAEKTQLFGARGLWGALSTIPFVYILYKELGDAIRKQSGRIQKLLENARLLLVGTWGFYPIAYMVPMFFTGYPAEAPNAVVIIEVGYTVADILAKAGYGLLIYSIAKAKSEEEGYVVEEMVYPIGSN